MQRQKKQFILIVILLFAALMLYGGLRIYNDRQQKQEEREAEKAKIAVTDIKENVLTSFSYRYEGETLEFVKEDGVWYAASDKTISIDQDKIASMLSSVLQLSAAEKLDSYDDLADYGLKEPKNEITLTTGTETMKLLLGDQNTMLSQYYVKKEGEDPVYLTETSLDAVFAKSVADMTKTEESTEDIEEASE